MADRVICYDCGRHLKQVKAIEDTVVDGLGHNIVGSFCKKCAKKRGLDKVSTGGHEPKQSIKRIIAREGLILISFACIFYLYWFVIIPSKADAWIIPLPGYIKLFLTIMTSFGYLFYVLIRFITWAIRALREK